LFWPHGATATLRRSIATAIAAAARYADAALEGVLAGGDEQRIRSSEAESAAAQSRLDAAFRQRLAERSSAAPKVAEMSRLMTATVQIYRTAAIERRLAERLGDSLRPRAAARLQTDSQRVADWYVAFGCAWAGLHIDELRRLEDRVAGAAQALQQPSSDGSDRAPDAGPSARAASALPADGAGQLDVTEPVGGRAHTE
jgi:hypothetical protein